MVRLKHRYIVCEIEMDGALDKACNGGAVMRLVRDAVQATHGDYGAGLLQPSLNRMQYTKAPSPI